MTKYFLLLTAALLLPLQVIHPADRSFGRGDLTALKKLVRENPTNVRYLEKLAGIHESGKDYSNASVFYRECIRLEPDQSSHYIRLASVYVSMGRPDHAQKILLTAAGDFPENGKVVTSLADAEYRMGNYEKAFAHYSRALELTGKTNSSFHYCGLAKTCRELKRYERSEYYFRKALECGKDLWTFYEYGKLLMATGKYGHAAWTFEKARSLSFRQEKDVKKLLDEKLAGAYYECGMSMKKNGRKDEAVKCFRKILDDREMKTTRYAEKAAFWLKRL